MCASSGTWCHQDIFLSHIDKAFEVCERNFFKIGCFHDGGSYDIRDSSKRPLPQQLLNDRDKTSKVHEVGFDTDWNNWEQSLHR